MNWKNEKLGEIVEIKKGQLITENTRIDGIIPVIAGGKKPTYFHNKANRFKKTVTISASGASAGFVSFHKHPIFASDCSTIEEGDYSLEFIYYQLKFLQQKIYNLQSGGAQPHVHKNDLEPLEISIPEDKQEQIIIAESLSEIDAIIDKIGKIIIKKKNIQQGAIQELITGKRRISGFNKKWKEITLEEVGSFTKGKGIKKTDVVDVGLPCIRYGEIYTKYDLFVDKTQSYIQSDIAKKSQQIKSGDLLFTGSGETSEEIGKCVTYQGKNPCYAGGDTIIFRTPENNPLFLTFLLNSDYVQKQKSTMAQGDMVVHIYSSSLKKLKIKIPDTPEQLEISKILFDLHMEIKKLETEKDKYINIKNGMMQKLLTGEIRLS
jgi:type I restriction enzyme, S subunit